MARFYGKVGVELPGTYVGGVWTANIEERDYKGDELSALRSLEPSEKVNDDYRLQNRISIVADVDVELISKIKYVSVHGVNWKVNSVDAEQRPRLILSLGGVYDGKTALDTPDSP